MLPILKINAAVVLPDNDQWQHRFQIRSETSNRLYTISQHKQRKHWGCSCPAWRVRRSCKHLQAVGLPGNETPYEVSVITE